MNRVRSIDFLRGIAVILILFRHLSCFDFLYDAGWIGVDLFFVLSGYLVSTLLFKEYIHHGKINAFRFLVRRGFKIYPLFYFAIISTVIIELLLGNTINPKNLISELVFIQNYFGSLWNHTWSLAVEEHFYFGISIILAIALKLKMKLSHKMTILVFISVFVFCLGLRCLNIERPYTHQTHTFATHLRVDSLLFGVLLSYLHLFKTEAFNLFFRKNQLLLYSVSLVMISTAFFVDGDSKFMFTIGFTILYIGFGILLALFLTNESIDRGMNKYLSKYIYTAVATVGFYSYGIYVFHMFIAKYLSPNLQEVFPELNFRINFLIYFILSIFLGILMSKIIEQPFLKLRDKKFPKQASIT
ncbi:MAG: acyltransferase [Crocinitomicaceae bacterium]|nr:acyltransferase [Crocinitomicaceae bacterium]